MNLNKIDEFLKAAGYRSTALNESVPTPSVIERHIEEKRKLNEKHRGEIQTVLDKYVGRDPDEFKMHKEMTVVHSRHNKEIEEIGLRHKKERGI
jgi:hypothetical protein